MPLQPVGCKSSRGKKEITGREWLGRLDSNQRSRDQNPMPYRLATPQ